MTARRPQVALVGLRGTGKTTVGRVVAARLGWRFADVDDVVEADAGMTVADIFRREGEAGFRARESAALAAVFDGDRVVVATGGGAVLAAANRDLLRRAGLVAWLTADPAVLAARLAGDPLSTTRRPALTGLPAADELAALLAARAGFYRAVATVTVPAGSDSPEVVADAILAAWVAGTHAGGGGN